MKGCPLKVTVTAVCDASRVICSGDGLGIGTVGKDIRSFIDTRAAGPGMVLKYSLLPHLALSLSTQNVIYWTDWWFEVVHNRSHLITLDHKLYSQLMIEVVFRSDTSFPPLWKPKFYRHTHIHEHIPNYEQSDFTHLYNILWDHKQHPTFSMCMF